MKQRICRVTSRGRTTTHQIGASHPAVVRFCMWLRTAALTFALCSCASLSRTAASTAETIYYMGEALTTGADGSVDRHTYLIARTSDQSAGTIAERAVTFTRGAYSEDSSVIKVDGNRISMMTAGGIEGKGELTGKPWEWTFLRLEFDIPRAGMKIVDYNFLAEYRTSVHGHKDFIRGGTLVSQEDVVLHAVDQAAYEAKRTELLRK